MTRNTSLHISSVCLLLLTLFPATAQDDPYRPALLFREDWREIPAEIPVTREHVSNQELQLHLYGPGKEVIKKSHHDTPVDDPYYVWSGLCEGNWLVTLEHTTHLADLSGFARIRWRSKQAGLRELRIVLKLHDGTWLVSRESDGPSLDWRTCEFNIQDLHWYTLNIETICEMKPFPHPDLTRVVEIGFTDLARGGGSDACSRLDWIEVYAEPATR